MCFACRVTMATDTHAEYLTVAFFSTRFACRVTMATDTHAEYLTFAFFSTRFACRVTMATDTHAEYLTFTFFFHGNNGLANAPQSYFYAYIACPVYL